MTSSSVSDPASRPARRFATTRWSLVLQAKQTGDAPARAALEELCQTYWFPVYAFMRRQTRDVHEAQDRTQGFFVSLLLHDSFADLRPDRGRFRSFLLAAASHFVSNERDYRIAAKRGGKQVLQSLTDVDVESRLSMEFQRNLSPEEMFERHCALALLDQVLSRLRAEYEAAGRLPVFELLSHHLSGEPSGEMLTETAASSGMSAESVRVALHRMRKRYRQILRNEIAQTTASAEEVDDEICQLFRFLQR